MGHLIELAPNLSNYEFKQWQLNNAPLTKKGSNR